MATAAKKRYRDKLKDIVFGHYGRACACCGSTERLEIDHVNGGGAAHRAQVGVGWAIYKWIIDNGFPEDFQTLCCPCNRSKGPGPRCRLDHPAVAA